MSAIDPARHADLIALQRAVYEATEALYAGYHVANIDLKNAAKVQRADA